MDKTDIEHLAHDLVYDFPFPFFTTNNKKEMLKRKIESSIRLSLKWQGSVLCDMINKTKSMVSSATPEGDTTDEKVEAYMKGINAALGMIENHLERVYDPTGGEFKIVEGAEKNVRIVDRSYADPDEEEQLATAQPGD